MYLYSWGTNAQNGVWTTLNSDVACEWYKDFKKQAWFGLDLSISLNQLLALWLFFFNCVFLKSYKDPTQRGTGHSLIRTRHKSQKIVPFPLSKGEVENGSLRSVSLRVHFLCGARRSGRAGREGLGLQRRPGLGTGSGPAAGPLAHAGWWAWSAVLLRQLVRSLPGHPTPLALTGLPGRPFSVSPAVASSPTAALRDDGALRFPPASPRDGFINSDSSLNPVLHLRSPCEPQELSLQRTKVLVFHPLKKSMISL